MKIPELLQRRAALGEQARAILLAAEKETRGLNGEEREKYDKLTVAIEGINSLISSERALSSALGAEPVAPEQRTARPGQRESRAATPEYTEAFDAYLRRGLGEISPDQRQLLHEVRAASPLSDVTGSAGAYTIPQGFYAQMQDAMKWFGGMRQVGATILPTSAGNDLPIPSSTDTSNVGELVAENTQVTQASTEMSFGQVVMKAYKYSSKLVLVPIELLQDSAFDIGAFVAKKLGQRIGRITNTHFTTGDNSSKPQGVIVGATTGVTGASGQTTKMIYADLVNLVHKVDPAYRAGAKWMMNDATAAYIEASLLDGNNRPIINSSLQGISGPVEAGNVQGEATLLGYPVVINNDVATMSASAKSIAFGDFSTYYIREVMDIQLVRFQEKYMDYGQIGFLAFYRGDGRCVDAGMHPIQLYVNSAS